jgi:hypothetical protein
MMRLFRLSEGAMNKPNAVEYNFPNVPSQLAERLVARFTESHEDRGNTVRKFPQRLKDKLLGYILCLCLLLEDFKIDASHLAADMNLGVAKTVAMCKELGCRIDSKKGDSSDGKKVAALVVPLTFPVRRK